MVCKINTVLPILIISLSLLPGKTYWVKYGWTSFEEAGDARSVALGNALSAAPDFINSSFINPSAPFGEQSLRVDYGHYSRFAGMITSDYLSFPYRSVIGLPVVFHLVNERIQHIPDTRNMLMDWGLDGEPGTGDPGEGNGILDEGERLDPERLRTFEQSQWGLKLSTSMNYRNYRVGVSVKGLYHALGKNFSNGIGFDVGVQKKVWQGGRIALVIHDATSSWLVWDNGTVERSRPKIIAGFSQTLELSRLPLTMTFLSDIIARPLERSLSDDWQIAETGVNYRLGFEAFYNNLLLFQLGRNQTGFYSTGLGVRWKEIGFQYAFQANPDLSLGQSHFLSILIDPELVWKWFN